jgi:hypothetical protein
MEKLSLEICFKYSNSSVGSYLLTKTENNVESYVEISMAKFTHEDEYGEGHEHMSVSMFMFMPMYIFMPMSMSMSV